MKRIHLFAVVLLALAATACQRDDATVRLRIFAESMSNGKMVMDGLSSSWETGDTLTINGLPLTIEVDPQGQAQVGGVTAANEYKALYPARIRTDETTVTLPSVYHYQTVGGNQKIDLPMAAYSTGGQLQFLHLTGAICVKFTNQDYSTVVMDSIVIISNRYAISGTRPIDFSDIANQSPRVAGTAADKRVTMLFDRSVTTLAQGAEKSVLLPVAPVGDDNLFTIKVCFHINGTRYTTQRTQSTAHAMPRNDYRTAMVPMTINGSTQDVLFANDFTDITPTLDTMYIGTVRDLILLDSAINNNWSCSSYNYRNMCYRLTADIDMSGITIAPISGFSGSSFNGGNHTISNLTIAGENTCALFASTNSNTTIEYLTIENVSLNLTGSNDTKMMSGLVGTSSISTINNCHVNNVTFNYSGTSQNLYLGLIAAQTTGQGTTTISNCSANSSIQVNNTGTIYYGGLAGYISTNSSPINATSCTITNNNLNLSATNTVYIGGAIGSGNSTSDNLSNVTWSGNMNITTNSNAYIGGLYARKTYNSSNPNTVTLNNDTVSGIINATVRNTPYIGKVFGSLNGNVHLEGNGCNSSGLDITNQ